MPRESVAAQSVETTQWVGDTLRVASDRLILDGQLPDLGVLNRYKNVEIWADTVEIRGCCRFIGQNVTIVSRRLAARNAALDASGAKVADMPDDPNLDAVPKLDERSPDLLNASFHGKDGRDGPNGNNGGRLLVYVGEFEGDLTLRADASDGGRGQRGGAGGSWPIEFQPAADYASRDGILAPGCMPETAKYGFKWLTNPAGPNGWFNDLHKRGAERWVVVYGWSGPKGFRGGPAGPPGRSGRGGDGGTARFCYRSKSANATLALSATQGRGGARQLEAHGGRGTATHSASRNALYCFFEKGGSFREGPFYLGGKVAKLFGDLRVPGRATMPPGSMGPVAGDYREGVPGVDGVAEAKPVDFGGMSELVGREFVQHLMDRAAETARLGATQSARERYVWLQELTRDRMPDLYQQICRSLLAPDPVALP